MHFSKLKICFLSESTGNNIHACTKFNNYAILYIILSLTKCMHACMHDIVEKGSPLRRLLS